MSGDLRVLPGNVEPLGLSFQQDRANFALFSSHATGVSLGLFREKDPIKEIPMCRTGDIWHIAIQNLPPDLNYAYRCTGPEELLYNPKVWLSDPYAKRMDKDKGRAAPLEPFDWQEDQPPLIPLSDLVLYEMHVRGFTQHPSSAVSQPGTYLGFIEKIPFLKELGINAVELMPIFDLDQTHCKNIDPSTLERRVNYWGYDPFHYFVPHHWYASSDPVQEFKTLVRELHKNGIEVILDVVFNHTGEGKERDFYVNFRGIDDAVYYMVDSQNHYLDFTGCGNTVNANHPAVQKLILDTLRYWVEEMHVDGFRFDLASILTRGTKGNPLAHPPLLEAMKKDPIISKVKWIAEAWDAAGLYQLGCFPKWGPWSEWNGRYRDVVRRFIKGTGKAGLFANVLTGTAMVYHDSTPLSSINFITAHDGYTLRDLVSYESKHNWANGEGNRDGNSQNDSWNCGVEGPTDNPSILSLRERQMRNFFLALFLSQGIPMLLMEDVYGHTRFGNNNPYVQDNEITWFQWDQLEKNKKIFQFVVQLIAFRKSNPQLRHPQFLTSEEIDWHSATPFKPDWSDQSHLVAFTLKKDSPIYAAFNSSSEPASLTLPPGEWRKTVLTSEDWQFYEAGDLLPSTFELPPYSALLAIQKK